MVDPTTTPTLTLCMIVRDEEACLARCLDSVQGVVDQVVIVDTGSVDATRSICARYGVTPDRFDFSFVDFAAARNRSLEKAKCDWILVLDADEVLDAASVADLRAILRRNRLGGYVVNRRNRELNGPVLFIDHAVRLFPRRADIRYRGRVHETVDTDVLNAGGVIEPTNLFIDHIVPNEAPRLARKQLYLPILLEEIALDPFSVDRLTHLAAEYHKLERYDDATVISEQIVLLTPNDPIARVNLGVYRFVHERNFQAARAEFETALRLRPNDAEIQALIGEVDAVDPPT